MELTRAAALVAAQSFSSGLFRMNGSSWRMWINSDDLMANSVEMGGDNHEGLFVAEVPFFGGGYYTIPSSYPESPFILEVLIDAVVHSSLIDDAEFRGTVVSIAQFGLYLSHECICRAGLSRHSRPQRTVNDEIRWPGEAKISARLQDAVTFDLAAVVSELERYNISSSDGIEHLAFGIGSVSTDYSSPLDNPTLSRPIALLGDELIVVAPTNLLEAIREAILNLADKKQLLASLMRGIEFSLWRRVEEYLNGWQWVKRGYRQATSAGEWDAAIYQFDDDKLAIVYLIVDDLTHGCRTAEQKHWDLSSQFESVRTTAIQVEQELPANVTETMHVVLLHGSGRPAIYSPPDPPNANSSTVCLTLDELRVVSQLSSDSLSIWQFAKSKQSGHGMVAMIAGGFLDNFARYQERNSFYHGDEGVPDLAILIGTGRNVRLEAQTKRDPHIVHRPYDSKYGRVFRLQNRADFPIYTVNPSSDGPIQLLIEGLPFPIWVISPVDGSNRDENKSLYYQLADVIAFWIWQLTPAINELCGDCKQCPQQIVLGVKVENPKRFWRWTLTDWE